jgi:8-oxo-dGTP pyrophosphatase MutT (NUDIX family)
MSDSPYHVCGFLYHPRSQRVLLHHRDANASALPSIWSFFCGRPEAEDCREPTFTWRREMREEIGVALEPDRIVLLWSYVNPQTEKLRFVFYSEWPRLTDEFVTGEGDGVGWFTLEEALQLSDLTAVAKEDLRRFAKKVGLRVPG